MTGDIDVSELIKWVLGIVTALLAWLYKGHERRIASLEVTRVIKADADEQRRALRDEVKEFRGETNARLEGLRNELLSRRSDDMRDLSALVQSNAGKIDELAGRVSSLIQHMG